MNCVLDPGFGTTGGGAKVTHLGTMIRSAELWAALQHGSKAGVTWQRPRRHGSRRRRRPPLPPSGRAAVAIGAHRCRALPARPRCRPHHRRNTRGASPAGRGARAPPEFGLSAALGPAVGLGPAARVWGGRGTRPGRTTHFKVCMFLLVNSN